MQVKKKTCGRMKSYTQKMILVHVFSFTFLNCTIFDIKQEISFMELYTKYMDNVVDDRSCIKRFPIFLHIMLNIEPLL